MANSKPVAAIMTTMTVTDLAIYPVKSTRANHINSAIIESMGFQFDRRWMVIDQEGQFVTQRKHPRMALINVTPEPNQITLAVSGAEALVVAQPDSKAASVKATVWKDTCDALDAGNHAALWLSYFLGFACRLVFFPNDATREVDQRYARPGDKTGFADGFPFLLTSESSLAELNNRLDKPVTMDRFRPNIVISGAESYAEDNWKRLRIGEVEFRVAKPCSRCVMTTVDPDKGEKEGKYPLLTLSRYRRTKQGVIFGQNLVHDSEGVIKVGDTVEVIE